MPAERPRHPARSGPAAHLDRDRSPGPRLTARSGPSGSPGSPGTGTGPQALALPRTQGPVSPRVLGPAPSAATAPPSHRACHRHLIVIIFDIAHLDFRLSKH